MMEHQNYCRHASIRAQAALNHPGSAFSEAQRCHLERFIALSKLSVKFILPPGGRVLDDGDLRGLDAAEKPCLPYDVIALEASYPPPQNATAILQEGYQGSPKSILLAYYSPDAQWIECISCRWLSPAGYWQLSPPFQIDRNGCKRVTPDGMGISIAFGDAPEKLRPTLAADAWALMSFLNALACCNVHVQRSEPKKAGKKIKSALPFDTYHYLTIDVAGHVPGAGTASGAHRSPREHLRRGHIRRLADGRRIWVNATVVAAGRGAGVVTKDYRFAQQKQAGTDTQLMESNNA